MPLVGHAGDLDLQPFDGGVDEARGAGSAYFLAQHVPRFDRLPELDRDAVVADGAVAREPKLDERREPLAGERVAERIEVGEQEVGGPRQGGAQRGVDHVGRRQPVVDLRAGRRADALLDDVYARAGR